MSAENKALVARWFEEVWNTGRVEAIDELLAEDGIVHGLSEAEGAALRGPADFKPFHQKFREAFPDIRVVVDDMVAEGDKVAARCSVGGQHRGDSLGFAATKLPTSFTGMVIVRISDGKIVEAWNNWDFMLMFQQLGVLELKQTAVP